MIDGAQAVRGAMVPLQDWVALEEHIPPSISSRALQRFCVSGQLTEPTTPACLVGVQQLRSCT